MVLAHHRLFTRASECLRQGDKKQEIILAGAMQILQEMVETQYSRLLNKIRFDRRIKDYARIANKMHAAEVEQRVQREQNLET
jgi:hypothetical protein